MTAAQRPSWLVAYVTGKASNQVSAPEPTAIFKTLGDPTRRALFERLSRDGEQTVTR